MAPPENDPTFRPKWTSSQPGDNYMVKAKELAPARGQSIGQRIVGYIRNDKRRTETVEVTMPHLPSHLWIDEAGFEVWVPYKTNRVHNVDGNRSRSIDDGNHANFQDDAHYGSGWLRYETGARGEAKDAWLARRESVIAQRKADQAGYMQEGEDRLKKDQKDDPASFKKMMHDFVAEALAEGVGDRERRSKAKKALDGE